MSEDLAGYGHYSKEDTLLNDPSVSFWLKRQLKETKKRDVLDALRDAEQLVLVLKQRCIDSGITSIKY